MMAVSHLAAIVEFSDDAIVGKDLDGVVTSWNRGAEKIFGYAAGEIVGESILRLIPAHLQGEEAGILSKIRRGDGVPPFETVRQTKNGRLIEVSITVSPIRDAGGAIVGASKILRDVSVLRKQEREIVRLSRLYSALSQINQAIVRLPDRDELFRQVCRHLGVHGGFHMAWIAWNDPRTHRLMPVAEWGDTTGYLSSVEIYSDDRPKGRGPTGLAFRSGQPHICNDMLEDPALSEWREQIRARNFRASANFPIRMAGRIGGVLTVYADQPGFFQDKEVALLEEAASDISFALDNLAREDERARVASAVRSEKLFSDAMIDSMPGIIYFYDETGRFLRWNRNFEAVSGYSRDEIARMEPLDFFPDDDRRLMQQRIAEVFDRGEAFVEARFRAKDGRTTPHFFTGRRVVFEGRTCLVGVGVDISERKRAEAAQRTSEARYRALFEYAPDGILIADTKSNYLDANASICRMLGYTHEELVGRHASDIVALTEVAQIPQALDDIEASAEHHREWQFRRKDGSTFPAEVIATMMPDGNLMAMIRDVTDRKAAELAMRELNQTLERKVVERTAELEAAVVEAEKADRIKSAFLAAMSHELRTPLNSIIGFTGIVLKGLAGPLNAEQTKQLGMVQGSARHLLDLINDVLDISKIEAGQLEMRSERFDLPALVERALASVKPLADRKGLTLAAMLATGLGEMVGDRRRVEQVLINLLGNAIKFTDRGSVTLTAGVVPGFRNAPADPPQEAARLRVIDTGIGIKPEDLATLFKPFRQIDSGLARQHEGTGLGLAICRRLATLMGGEISATSTWQKGSEFVVTLPLQRPSAS
ncbi:MAG: PAS domain S-box protein [Alphaproteobacteria bacterium]|nr:PAS domain S-box protein [Alphaproteobacteria bacterium]